MIDVVNVPHPPGRSVAKYSLRMFTEMSTVTKETLICTELLLARDQINYGIPA